MITLYRLQRSTNLKNYNSDFTSEPEYTLDLISFTNIDFDLLIFLVVLISQRPR